MGRFAVIPAAAVDDPRMTPAALMVLVILSTYADKSGWCWPHQETLAQRLGKTRQAIGRQMQLLEELAYIERNRTRQGTRYRLLFDRHMPGVTQHDVASEGNDTLPDRQPHVAQKETNEGKTKRRAPRTPLPDGWTPSAKLLTWAAEKCPRVDLQRETDKWMAHHEANASTFPSWDGAWRTWMLRAIRDYENVEPFPHHQSGRRRGGGETDDERRARLARIANRRLADQAPGTAGDG